MHLDHSVIITENEDGEPAAIVKIAGSIEYDLIPALRIEIDHTLKKHRTGGVIVDLSELERIDSCAVGLFAGHCQHGGIGC